MDLSEPIPPSDDVRRHDEDERERALSARRACGVLVATGVGFWLLLILAFLVGRWTA